MVQGLDSQELGRTGDIAPFGLICFQQWLLMWHNVFFFFPPMTFRKSEAVRQETFWSRLVNARYYEATFSMRCLAASPSAGPRVGSIGCRHGGHGMRDEPMD